MGTVLKRSVPTKPQTPSSPSYEALLQELAAQDQAPAPGFSPDQVERNLSQNDDMAQLGLVGAMASDLGTAPIGGQVFKQALAGRQPRITSSGAYDPLRGTTVEDPLHAETRQEARKDRILKLTLGAEEARQRALDRQQQAYEHEQFLREMQAARIQGMKEVKQTVPGKAAAPAGPPKMTSSDSKELSTLQQEMATVGSTIALVEANPDAFGFKRGLPEAPGGTISQMAMSYRDSKMPEAALTARNRAYNEVSAVIKARAGTAQSAGERQILAGFLPTPYDNASVIATKFKAYVDYMKQKADAIQSRYAGPSNPVPVTEVDPDQPMNPSAREPVATTQANQPTRKVKNQKKLPNGVTITEYENE